MKIEIISGQLSNLPDKKNCPIGRFCEFGNLFFRFADDPNGGVFYKYPTIAGRAAIVTDEGDHYRVTPLQINVDPEAKICIVEVARHKRICF